MPAVTIKKGYSSNGLPYARIGNGERILVVFDGLDFSHKPPGFWAVRVMSGLNKRLIAAGYSIYQVRRKPGLPQGYTMEDMARDYAEMIKSEFKTPVDVMGCSTGGPIALCFAADYPELIHRLVLESTGCRLREKAKPLMLKMAALTREGKWRAAASLMAEALASGTALYLYKPWMWLMGKAVFDSPSGPADDGIAEIMAEDTFDFWERLREIKCPTLVIGGDRDFFYDIKELADGIHGSSLILYNGVGHGAIMKREFSADVTAFLTAS